MTKDSPSSSGGGGGPPSPRAPRPSPRRAPGQHPGGGSHASCSAAPPLFHEDHRRELEALRAELEAERLRSQEARRRFAVEARELREAAERERQLLADQLRSKWEQQRARELHQLREATQRQREAEIRQLLRWKEAELREAQELLQRERDAAMRQARDLQRQLAEELVSRGGAACRGASGGGLSTEGRAKLQEVLGKLRWEVDGEQAARIRHLKAELELERSLFLKYILQRFEGESLRAGSPHRFRQASSQSQQRLARTRPRSLESLLAACTPDVQAVSNQSCSPTRGESPCSPQVLEEGKPADSSCPEQPHEKVEGKELHVKEESKQESCTDAPPEGKVSCWGAAGERTPEAAQGQGWLSGHSYDQLMKQNTELLNTLSDLEQRCTHLKEENALLRRSSFPEIQDKVKRLKGKNAELAVIAKRLEDRAKKLQESHLRVSSTPIPLALNCSEMELCKDVFAQRQAKDLNEEASALLAKDQQLETLQKECQELQAKLSAGKENTYLLSISDLDRLLRESQREVLRLQRQITLKTLKESLQSSKIGSNASSSSVSKQEASLTINVHLEDSSLAKKTPKTLNILKRDVESEALSLGNEAKNYKNSTLKTGSNSETYLQLLEKQCETLRREVKENQKRYDEVQLKLKKVLHEYVRMFEENSQLHGKSKWAEKIENENADMKIKLRQATDERDSAVQLTKGLEAKVENLEQVIKDLKEIAERQQQLEPEPEKTLLELQKKEEIQQMQQVQLHEAQMKELENQYHSQTEHFNLQFKELERLQIKKAGLLGSELSHTTCSSTGMNCPEKWEQDTYHALHCSNSVSDEDCVSMASVESIQKVKELESCANSSGSESMQNSSKSCLNPEEDTLGEMEELETDKVSLNLQSEDQGPSKLRVFLSRYSYDPFSGPNKNPEAELPLTAGEYVYIYGEMDEDGFYKGELMDGRRGIVPSNLVEEVPGNDLISFIPSEPSEISCNSFHESSFLCQSASSGEKSNSPDEDICSHLLSNRPEGELDEVQAAVPYPQNLTLIKQSARSIIIGWDPPQILDNWGEIQSYNIYVNTELRQNVKCGSQMKTVIENLDLKLQTYRISVQSVTDKGNSDRMQCTFLVGNTFHIAPTVLNLYNVTATAAKITWLPSNSNCFHKVYLNEKEYDVTKAGIYCYRFQNLKPSTQYSVKVEPLIEELVYTQGGLEQKSTAISFTTPSAGPPDTPLDVQVQLGSSADILVISWLPVTIDAAGSSNGVKVIGYAIYINGQKVTKVMSPTAGSVSLKVSQVHMFQGPWKISVRTVSLFGESEDSVPALVPLTLLKVSSALLSKFVASELTVKELLESEGMPVHATTCTSSLSFSHMCVPSADTNFTIHFTANCKDSVVPMPLNNISQNRMSSSPSHTMRTSHIIKNENNGDSILQISVGQQTLQQSFPPLCCETSANSTPTVLEAFTEDTDSKRSRKCLTKNVIVKNKLDNRKVFVMTAEDLSCQSFLENSDANCSSPEPSLSSMEFELKKHKDAGLRKICLQEAPAIFPGKDQMQQIKQLCRKLSKLTVSKVETQEDDSLRIGSWQISLGEYSHNSDLSDIEEEEEEDQETKWGISGEDVCKTQENPGSSLELPKDKIMTLRADQTVIRSVSVSGPQRSIASGDSVNEDPARLFVALFDSDPTTMLLNSDIDKEQLPFKKGQVLKVIGDKDAGGFYRGECEGRKGFIPCNMVSEMHIDSTVVKDYLLKKTDENL